MRRMLTLLCAVLIASSAVAVDQPGLSNTPEYDPSAQFTVSDIARREPSIFHRPEKGEPKAQLEYAQSLLDAGRIRSAGNEFVALVHQWHEAPEAPMAMLGYADVLERRGRYEDAFREYQYLVSNYGGQFDYNTVLDRQFRIANHIMKETHYALWVIPYRDPELSLPYFEKIVANGPGWKRTPDAQFTIGVIYEETEQFAMAIDAFETVVQRFVNNPLAIDADFRIGYCLYQMAKGRKYEEKAAQRAKAHLAGIIKRYPDHEMSRDAAGFTADIVNSLAQIAYERALFYDRKRGRERAALVTYRDFVSKFPESSLASKALARISELEKALGAVSDAGESAE